MRLQLGTKLTLGKWFSGCAQFIQRDRFLEQRPSYLTEILEE